MEGRLPFLTRWSARRFDWTVLAIAVAARLAILAVFQAKNLGDAYGRDLYFNLALSWLGYLPMPDFDATHPPLFTLIIAGILGLLKTDSQYPILMLNVLLGGVTPLILRRAAGRLVDEKTARLAALWLAVDPAVIFFTPQLQTETLFVFLLTGFFWGAVLLWNKPLSFKHAVLGLIGGLAVSCKSVFGAFPGILFFFLWRAKGFRHAVLFSLLLAPGWFLPSALWTYRNYEKYGRLVPLSGQMGWNLYEGFTLDRDKIRSNPIDMAAEAKANGVSDRDIGAYFFDKTMSLVKESPLQAAGIVAGKAFLYWRPWLYDPYTLWQRIVMGVYFTALFAFAVLGARTAARTGAPWGAVWALLIYHTMAHAVFLTTLRYRVPLEPFLCLLAAAGAMPYLRGRRA